MGIIKKSLIFLLLSVFIFLFFNFSSVSAQEMTPVPTPENSKAQEDLQNKIKELEGKVSELKNKENTLSSQIDMMDNQIKLTEYRMNATNQQIAELTEDIVSAGKRMKNLEVSLTDVTKVLINRIAATYKAGNLSPFELLLTSSNARDLISRANYLRIVQEHDKRLIYDTQQARNDYENQKLIMEEERMKIESLRQQLEDYADQMDQQKNEKKRLLAETKGSEQNYQQLLAQARAEYAAIQGIIAGNGTETEAGSVSEGGRIASVIPGASCNSSGGHLHFIVKSGGSSTNPFGFLRSIDHNNCSGSSCGSSDGDPFNPSGGWEWPINGPIEFFQGYGSTWAVRNTWVGRIYNFHDGIDIYGSSNDVKAVKAGVLYRGSYSGSGCRLPYVRLKHTEGNLETLYLHVYY